MRTAMLVRRLFAFVSSYHPSRPTRTQPAGPAALPRRAAGACRATAAPLNEQAAWRKRKEESGAAGHSTGGQKWEWTLNWDEVMSEPGGASLLIGSCPRSVGDVTRLAVEAKATAILCLQSEDCLRSLNVPMVELKERCLAEKLLHVCVAVRDFDKDDQAAMLPDVVRALAVLMNAGHRVYVHCTAGINRAPLAVVAYLCFARGWVAADALSAVKAKRSQANPYMEMLWAAKARMLHGRSEELTALSRSLYEKRCATGMADNGRNDWFDAEDALIQRMYARRAITDSDMCTGLEALLRRHGDLPRAGSTEEETRLTAALAAAVAATAAAEEHARSQRAQALRDAAAAAERASRELAQVRAEAAAQLSASAAAAAAAEKRAAAEAAAAAREAAAQLAAAQSAAAAQQAAQQVAAAKEEQRASAELAQTQRDAAAALAAAQSAAAELLAQEKAASARELAKAQRDASEAARAAAVALEQANSAVVAALSAAAQQAQAELEAAVAERAAAEERAARTARAAKDAADVGKDAAAARAAVLDNVLAWAVSAEQAATELETSSGMR